MKEKFDLDHLSSDISSFLILSLFAGVLRGVEDEERECEGDDVNEALAEDR